MGILVSLLYRIYMRAIVILWYRRHSYPGSIPVNPHHLLNDVGGMVHSPIVGMIHLKLC